MPAALAYGLCVLIWGNTYFAIKFQLGLVPETVSLVYRFGLAALILLAYLWLRRENFSYGLKTHLWFVALGATLFCFNYLFTYMVTNHLPSGLVSILFSSVAFFSALNGWLFLRERVSRRIWLGIIIGMAGVGILFMHKIGAVDFAQASALSFALVLMGSYLSSLGNMIAARLQDQVPALHASCWGMIYGVVIQIIVVLLRGEEFIFDPRPAYIASLLFLSIFGSVIAFMAWFILIKRIGLARAGYVGLITPLVALLMSTLFENFQWTPEKILGVTIILAGKALVMTKPEHLAWLRRQFAPQI